MNLKKLASLAHVSISTVSKALSDSPEISEETREMILSLAKEHGCFEKYYKPKYKKRVIAVICPEILGLHYGKMATDMEKEISSRGDTMLLSVTGFSHKTQSELIDYYIRFCHVDGIIIIEPAGRIKSYPDTPIVRIDFENELKNTDCVKAEISPAMDEALSLLVSNGHKNIGFIGEKFAVPEQNFFLSAMARSGIEVSPESVLISDRRFEAAGYSAMSELLARDSRPTAIFAAYSHIAIGILQCLKERELSSPRDLSLICMDDIKVTEYSDCQLSCIRLHLDELSREAVSLLYRKIDESTASPKHEITVIREFFEGETIGSLC